jgi:hypothetical protein
MITLKENTVQEVWAHAENPISDEFSSFSLNRNQWLPLWLYVCGACEDILDEKRKAEGFYNMEDLRYTEEQAIRMAKKLDECLKSGDFSNWLMNWTSQEPQNTYTVSESDLESFIKFCGFSGGFIL